MSKQRILVVTQYYFPEQFRINDICEEWVNRGNEVTVLTGIPNYPDGHFYEGYSFFKRKNEVRKGVNIIRLPLIPRGNNSIMLILNYFSFVISGFFWVLFYKSKSKFDLVFTYEVSPMTQALPAIWFSKRKGIPHYLYVTDLWPENVQIVTGLKNKHIIKALNMMVDYIYKNSLKILTASKSFKKSIINKGFEESKIEFWPQYAEEFYKPVPSERNSLDKPVFVFAGNIGFAQGLEILPDTAELLIKKNQNFLFRIIGDGRYKQKLISEVQRRRLDCYFEFIPKQSAESIPTFFAQADAALITLAKNEVFAMTIPAKTQSCLACGIPIIVSGDGEIQDIVKEANCGLYGKAGSPYSLSKNIEKFIRLTETERKAMSFNGIRYFEKNYSKKKLLDKIDNIFMED